MICVYSGVVVGSCWGHVGIILESWWGHRGITLEAARSLFKPPRPAHCKNTQNTRGGFRHSRIIQQCSDNCAALRLHDAPSL